jgi:hypothetical protein
MIERLPSSGFRYCRSFTEALEVVLEATRRPDQSRFTQTAAGAE